MARYQRNNIIFRIASADAISKFKKIQASALMQLARKDINFNESAKEVILLEYDKLSMWILRIERICLAAESGHLPEALASGINESFAVELKETETIFDSYPEVFVKLIADFVRVIHHYVADSIHDQIKLCLDENIDRAFEKLVDVISVYMQHLLICMHEVNNNMEPTGDGPFVTVGEFCMLLREDERFKPTLQRAKYFEKMGYGNTYLLKCYTDEDIYSEAAAFFERNNMHLIQEC